MTAVLLLIALFIRIGTRQWFAAAGNQAAFPVYLVSSYVLLPAMAWTERKRLATFNLTAGNLRQAIREGLLLSLLAIPQGLGAAWLMIGHVAWAPPRVAIAALASGLFTAALIEEPLFRGFLLGFLRRWGLGEVAAVVVQAIVFLAGHLRYAARGQWWMFGWVLAFGLILGWQASRHRTIAGTVVTHALVNTIVFMFIGGAITSL